EGLLQRTAIHIAWQNSDEALISSGLKEGDQLVLTPLGQVSSGTPVKLLGEEKIAHAKQAKNRSTDKVPATDASQSN
ncbi:MAG: efflux RND transporter periplasmic adaptor subunit, partial [Sedimenticola sp.]|nr:efflux RND transporter periplasmic adaptor subunit [Sedimenticola sp.]